MSYERLKEIPLIFLPGVAVSDETWQALRRCVAEGATLVVWGGLAKKVGFREYVAGVQEIVEGNPRLVFKLSGDLPELSSIVC